MDVATASLTHPPAAIIGLLPAGLSDGQIVLILVILVITALMLVSTRRRLRESRNSPKAYAREQIARLRDEHAVVSDMEEVMARLEQVAREVQARIDTRFAKLESVIRDADQRIDRLERLIRRADGDPEVDITIDDTETAAPAPSPASAPSTDDAQHAAVYDLADAGQSPVEIAEQTGQSTGEIELILALRRAAAGISA
ncbi:MAG: hypothetical protein GY778_31760 [bacterium]|nr:hypothetical protein [bacterium]